MQIIETKFKDVKLIEPKVFGDSRGFFFESYQNERYQKNNILSSFVQDNISRSQRGVVRGLHYQLKFPQGKLITVVCGEVFDVVVDIRLGSPTFGKWEGFILNDINHHQVYIPPGFAHGFCVLSEVADFHYKCTEYYHPEDEHGVIWNDSDIGIEWPKFEVMPVMSAKDMAFQKLYEIAVTELPQI